MIPAEATPIEYFWAVVGNLGMVPWALKAIAAALMLPIIYLLPRRPEHWPLGFGLFMVAVSPFFPPLGPFGDWLVYPSAAVMIIRLFLFMRPYLKAQAEQQGPSREAILLAAMKRTFTKASS